MTPGLRRALHQCIDILCDALADEEAETPKKRTRGPSNVKKLPLPVLSTEERAKLEAQLDRQLARNGYKTG